MSDYNKATFLLKRLKKENSLEFFYHIEPTMNRKLFDFLSRVLNNSPHKISKWTTDESLVTADDVYKVQIIVYPPNDIINEGHPKNVVSYGQKSFDDTEIKTPIIHIALTDILSENRKLHPSVPRYYHIIDSSIWNHYVPMVKFDDQEDGFYYLFTKAVDEIYENYQCGLYDMEVAEEFADVNARVLQQSYLCGHHAIGIAPFIFHSETTIKKLSDTEFEGFKSGFIKKKEGIAEEDQDANWRWRFLLVDDKAIEKEYGKLKKNCKLSIIMRLIEKALFPGKGTWIQYRLLEQRGEKLAYSEKAKTIDKNAKIVIECVHTYNDAIVALKDRKYDLILLDYLLDLKDGQRKYGYELLEEINRSTKIKKQFERFRFGIDYSSCKEKVYALKDLISEKNHVRDNNELIDYIRTTIDDNFINDESIEELLDNIQTEIEKKQFQIGPCGKLFFIFISAYSTAVNERLLAQGLNRSEDFWYINTGACPTNTPQLFTFNLLHSMNKRLNDCGIIKLSTDRILELVAKIFKPVDNSDKWRNSVRKRASRYYHEVLSLQYYYRSMMDDLVIPHNYKQTPESIFEITGKGSVLISDYSFKNQHLSGLVDHLANLVHIAAFGTIRQWDEMWEEYLYFKNQFNKVICHLDEESNQAKEEKENNKSKTSRTFQRVSEHIESFILELKSQQR